MSSNHPNKIALCFIISYKHVLNQESFWKKWIEPNKEYINVYVHYKDIGQIKSPWLRSHAIPPQYIAPTSYFHVVPAYISLLSFARHHDANNQWFCMLTESCIPIISPQLFKQRFQKHGDKTLLGVSRANWNPDFHARANLKRLPPELYLMHDPWFTLTRIHVDQIIQFIIRPETRVIYSTVCAGGLANETVFAIMLGIKVKENGDLLIPSNQLILNTSATVADWTRRTSATSPYVFSGNQPLTNRIVIQRLLDANPLSMFLRKVSPDFCVK